MLQDDYPPGTGDRQPLPPEVVERLREREAHHQRWVMEVGRSLDLIRAFWPECPEERLQTFRAQLLGREVFFRAPAFQLPLFMTRAHPFLRKFRGDVRKFREKAGHPALKMVFPRSAEFLPLLSELEQALDRLPPPSRRPKTSGGRNLVALEAQARGVLDLYLQLEIPSDLSQTAPAWSNASVEEKDRPLFQQLCRVLIPHCGESVIRQVLSSSKLS